MYDVVVIGAGPGGSTCANELAKKGFNVALVEKETLKTKCKACAGGLGPRIWEGLGIPENVIERFVSKVNVHSPSAKLSIDLAKPNATVSRAKFDNFLSYRAVDNGAELFENTRAVRLEKNGTFTKVLTNGEKTEFAAKVFVCADGVNSILSGQRTEKGLVAVGAEYEIEDVDEPDYQIYYMPGLSPTGYGWIIPKKDTATLGVLGFPDQLGNNIKFYLDYLYEKHPHCSKIVGKKKIFKVKGWTIPYKAHKQMVFDNVMGVGDAVGLTSPLTGGGIYYSTESGKIAAGAISEHLENGKPLNIYEKLWMQRHGKSIKMQHRMAALMRKLWTDKGWDDCVRSLSANPEYAKVIGESWSTYTFENKKVWANLFGVIFRNLLASKLRGKK